MAPAPDQCLVCNGRIQGEASNVFEKGMLGLQPLKERLQVVLQVELDEARCHSCLLCKCCEEKMEDIDDYQCNVDSFRETFQHTLEQHESQGQTAPNECVCLVCNQGHSGSQCKNIFVEEDVKESGLKGRLESVLLMVLDSGTCNSPMLCAGCERNLHKIDSDRIIVNEFAQTFRQTKALYANGDSNNNKNNRQKFDSEPASDTQRNNEGVVNGQKIHLSGSFSSTATESSDLDTSMEDVGEANGVGDGSDLIIRNKETFECTYTGCSYQNTRLCHIKTHVRMHTGWKPFLCDYCNRRFSDKSNCSKHQRRCYYKSQGQFKAMDEGQGYYKGGMDRYPAHIRPEVNGFIQGHPLQGHFKGMDNNSFRSQGHLTQGHLKVTDEGQIQSNSKIVDGYVKGHVEEDAEMMEDEYECSVCSAVFSTVEDATSHMRIHSNNTNIPIVAIGEVKEPVIAALESTDEGESALKRRRKLSDVGMTLSDNLIIERNGLFMCSVCNYQRPSFKHVQSHARTHTGEKPFVCSFCGGRFADPSNYNRHVNKHMNGEKVRPPMERNSKSIRVNPALIQAGAHIASEDQGDSDQEDGDLSPSSKRIKPFECSMCRDSFDNAVDLTEHIRNHLEGTSPKAKHVSQDPAEAFDNVKGTILDVGQHDSGALGEGQQRASNPDDSHEDACYRESPDADDENSNSISEAYREALILYDDTRTMYRCAQCRYENNILYNLRKHIRTHTGEKPYKCDFCDQRFADKSNQRKHERKHHSEGKVYEYPVDQPATDPAPAPTPAPTILPVMGGTKRYKCDRCFVSFRYEETLRKHQELHEGDEPFTCSICQKNFLSSVDLQCHIVAFHKNIKVDSISDGDNTQLPVSAVEATKASPVGRTDHPFSCTECGVIFATSTNLQQHMLREHGIQIRHEEPSSDSQDKVTLRSQTLKREMQEPNIDEDEPYSVGGHGSVQSTEPQQGGTAGLEQDMEGSSSEFRGESSHSSQLAQLPSGIEQTADGFRCRLCGHENTRLSNIRNHQRNHHSEGDLYNYDQKNADRMNLMFDAGEGYLCKVCPFKSYFITKMRRHIRSVHGMDAALEASVPSGHTLMHKNSATGYFECLICGVRHRAATHLMTHIKNKHPVEFNSSHDGGSGREDMDIPMSDDPPTVGGPKPGKAARRLSDETLSRLQQQQQQHHQQQQEKQRLLQQQQLQQQLQQQQMQQQQLQKQQLKQQLQQQQLKQHIKKQQELQLKQKQLLQQQQLLQEQQRLRPPFRCAMCSEAFHEPGDLQVHFGEHCRGQVYPFTEVLKTQVAREGVKKLHPCPHCGAVYIHPHNMQRHLLTHSIITPPGILPPQFQMTPSIAQQQYQMFAQQAQMAVLQPGVMDQSGSVQLVSPSGGTGNFRCPICFVSFIQPQQLMVHMELHQQIPHQMSQPALSPGVAEIQQTVQTMKLPTKTDTNPLSQFLNVESLTSETHPTQVIKIEPGKWESELHNDIIQVNPTTPPSFGHTMKLPVTIGTITPIKDSSSKDHSSMSNAGNANGSRKPGIDAPQSTGSSLPITIQPEEAEEEGVPQLRIASPLSIRANSNDFSLEHNVGENTHRVVPQRTDGPLVEKDSDTVPGSPASSSEDGDRKLSKPAICSLCGATFFSKMKYLRHLQYHTKFRCPTCGTCFQEINELYEHFDQFH